METSGSKSSVCHSCSAVIEPMHIRDHLRAYGRARKRGEEISARCIGDRQNGFLAAGRGMNRECAEMVLRLRASPPPSSRSNRPITLFSRPYAPPACVAHACVAYKNRSPRYFHHSLSLFLIHTAQRASPPYSPHFEPLSDALPPSWPAFQVFQAQQRPRDPLGRPRYRESPDPGDDSELTSPSPVFVSCTLYARSHDLVHLLISVGPSESTDCANKWQSPKARSPRRRGRPQVWLQAHE